jgi:hypothetical protein
VPAPDAPATPARITIEEATSIFIANRESSQIAPRHSASIGPSRNS